MDNIMEIITKNARETFELGKKIAAGLKGGEVLALTGPLGAGKTTFVQGLAEGLGVKGRIVSPSYVLMREYLLNGEKGEKGAEKLYHVDFYRLERAESEVEGLGLPEIWGRKENVVVIEWAEKAKRRLPGAARWVEFSYDGEGEKRRVRIVDSRL